MRLILIFIVLGFYCLVFYVLSTVISSFDFYFLRNYINDSETERFRPFISRSPQNKFPFRSLEEEAAEEVNLQIQKSQLFVNIIQPRNYFDLHSSPLGDNRQPTNGFPEDDLVLNQNDSVIFELTGSLLQYSPGYSGQSVSGSISCLQTLVQLRHSTDYESNIREIYHQLPLEGSQVARVELKIIDQFFLPSRSQTYRLQIQSQLGFCYQQPMNETHSIRFEGMEGSSLLPPIRASRIFYLIIMRDEDIVAKKVASLDTARQSNDNQLERQASSREDEPLEVPLNQVINRNKLLPISSSDFPTDPAMISSASVPTQFLQNVDYSFVIPDHHLVLPKQISMVLPKSGDVFHNINTLNITIALPVSFYTLSDCVRIDMMINNRKYDVTQSLLQIVPPSDLMEKDVTHWRDYYVAYQGQNKHAVNRSLQSLREFMQESLSSQSTSSNRRSFLTSYLYLVWIQLQDMPQGVYQISLHAFIRNPILSTTYALLGFDSIFFELK